MNRSLRGVFLSCLILFAIIFGMLFSSLSHAAVPGIPILSSPGDKEIRYNSTPHTFSWSPVSGATYYEIWVNNGSGFNAPLEISYFPPGTSYSSSSLLDNNRYYWMVRAINSEGAGQWSSMRQFVVDREPLPPTLGSPSHGSSYIQGDTIEFSWSGPFDIPNIDRYYLRIVPGTNFDADPIFHQDPSPLSPVYLNTTGWPTGTYTWGVRAIKRINHNDITGYDQWTYEQIINWGPYDTGTFTLSAVNPYVSVSPSSGFQTTTFDEPGSGFTPNGLVTLHFRKPDGTEYPTYSVQADSNGTYQHSWSCNGCAVGTYQYWAVDNTTQLSSNIAPFEVVSYPLSVIVWGNGHVTSSPAGINCGLDCKENYSGTTVTLTATPNSGNSFSGWTGSGCSGTGNCTLEMTAAKKVTATFASCSYNLSATSTTIGAAGGSGSVTLNCAPQGVTPNPSVPWIHAALSGSQVNFTVDPNGTGIVRTGTINISGQIFTINQGAPAGPRTQVIAGQDVNMSNIQTSSDWLSVWINLKTSPNPTGDICNLSGLTFRVIANNNPVNEKAADCKATDLSAETGFKRYRLDFKIKANGRAAYFENGTIQACWDTNCSTHDDLFGGPSSGFSFYGTTFDMQQHAWSFGNGSWVYYVEEDKKTMQLREDIASRIAIFSLSKGWSRQLFKNSVVYPPLFKGKEWISSAWNNATPFFC